MNLENKINWIKNFKKGNIFSHVLDAQIILSIYTQYSKRRFNNK